MWIVILYVEINIYPYSRCQIMFSYIVGCKDTSSYAFFFFYLNLNTNSLCGDKYISIFSISNNDIIYSRPWNTHRHIMMSKEKDFYAKVWIVILYVEINIYLSIFFISNNDIIYSNTWKKKHKWYDVQRKGFYVRVWIVILYVEINIYLYSLYQIILICYCGD